jgi:hypothetical protein
MVECLAGFGHREGCLSGEAGHLRYLAWLRVPLGKAKNIDTDGNVGGTS